MDKVSIIIPIYNCKEYLKKCLDSIVNQTYPQKMIEVIMVNDGSKDESDKICKEYSKKNNWVFINRKINKGLAYTRNEGIAKATGDFIMFLDSDDLLYKDALQLLINNQHKYNSDIAISRLNSFNSKGEYGYYSDKYLKKEESFSLKNNYKIINCMSVCGKLYKTSLIKAVNFIDGVIHEDNYYTLCVFYKSKILSILPEYTYYRRIREDDNKSIMQNLSLKTYNDLIINFKMAINDIELIDYKVKSLMFKKLINYVVMNIKEKDTNSALNTFNNFVDEALNKYSKITKIYVKIKFKVYYRVAKMYKKMYNIFRLKR